MVTGDDTLWNEIVALVEEMPTAGLSRLVGAKQLTRETDLVADLGLVGDDAFEFMEKYAARLNVKRGDYDASAYFEPEGLWILPRFGKRKPKKRITLGMLELAARDGEWSSARLDRAGSDSATARPAKDGEEEHNAS